MIAKIFPSRSGGGGAATVKYAFGQTEHKDEHQAAECEFLTSNLLVVPDPTMTFEMSADGLPELGRIAASKADVRPIIEQFEDLASRNSRVQEPYFHAMLSFSPEDEAKLTQEMMGDIAQQFMSDMGFDDAAWVATVHRDTDHTHIHFAACTVQNLPGYPAVPAWNNYQRAMDSVRQIEADYGLEAVHMPDEGKRMDGRVDRETAHEIRDIIDVCVAETIKAHPSTPTGDLPRSGKDSTPLQTFVTKMASFGVDVQFQFKEGKPSGISYSMNDASWSGGKLRGGGRFTLPGLERRGVAYQPKDKEMCERVTAESKERRGHEICLVPKRFLGDCRTATAKGSTEGGYKHAEPKCLLKMSFSRSYATTLNSSPCPPHYAVKTSSGVDAFWRLGNGRAGVNAKGSGRYDFIDELLARIKKAQRESELQEQMENASRISIVHSGLAPGQNPYFCTPRAGIVPSDAKDAPDPAKIATGWIL